MKYVESGVFEEIRDRRQEEKMANQKTLSFDKDLFKRSVVYNVKTLYRKSMEEATPQQVFQAVSYSIKDAVIDHWMTSREEYEKQDPKMVDRKSVV